MINLWYVCGPYRGCAICGNPTRFFTTEKEALDDWDERVPKLENKISKLETDLAEIK
jgi:hypothetical protein